MRLQHQPHRALLQLRRIAPRRRPLPPLTLLHGHPFSSQDREPPQNPARFRLLLAVTAAGCGGSVPGSSVSAGAPATSAVDSTLGTTSTPAVTAEQAAKSAADASGRYLDASATTVVVKGVFATTHAGAAQLGLTPTDDGDFKAYVVVLEGVFDIPTSPAVPTTEGSNVRTVPFATFEVNAETGEVGSLELTHDAPSIPGTTLVPAGLAVTVRAS